MVSTIKRFETALPQLMDGQLGYCNEDESLYIGLPGGPKKIGSGGVFFYSATQAYQEMALVIEQTEPPGVYVALKDCPAGTPLSDSASFERLFIPGYSLPAGGIPASDLSQEVQADLGVAGNLAAWADVVGQLDKVLAPPAAAGDAPRVLNVNKTDLPDLTGLNTDLVGLANVNALEMLGGKIIPVISDPPDFIAAVNSLCDTTRGAQFFAAIIGPSPATTNVPSGVPGPDLWCVWGHFYQGVVNEIFAANFYGAWGMYRYDFVYLTWREFYFKLPGGIPYYDLDAVAQANLNIAQNLAAWAKAPDKPVYTYSEVGAASAAQGAKADSALQSFTETDPTVPAWAKAPNKPSYTPQEVGAATAAQGAKADAALPLAGGALSGKVTAGGPRVVTEAQVRNVYAGTTDLTAGSSPLPTGDIYLVYDAPGGSTSSTF